MQLIFVIVNFTFSFKEESNIETKNMFHQMTLMWGPSLLLTVMTLALSYKKLVFAELILPMEIISMGITLIFINMTDIIEEKNSQFRQYNMLIFSISYIVLCLFISASWMIGFLLRAPFFLIVVRIGIAFRIDAGDEIVVAQSIFMSYTSVFMIELAIYLNVKAQVVLF